MASKQSAADNTPSKPPRLDMQNISINDKLMCAYKDGLLYEAKVIRISGLPGMRKFKLHYPGWDKSDDEVVDEAKAAARFHEYTPEIAKDFKDLHKRRLAEELKGERLLKRRSIANDMSFTASKPTKTAPDVKRHRPDERYDDFRALILQKALKKQKAGENLSKTSISKEIQSEASDRRFTDDEIDGYFERLLEDNTLMFEDNGKDLFLMI